MAEKKAIDWEAVELDYRAGVKTLKAMGAEYGVSDAGILKRAKRDGWTRDLSARRAEKVVLSDTDEMESAGFLYVIYIDAKGDRYYKIGMAKRFDSRFAQHQCASPFDICVALCYFVGNMRAEERELHAAFRQKQVRGEWFQLDSHDLSAIAARSLLVNHD